MKRILIALVVFCGVLAAQSDSVVDVRKILLDTDYQSEVVNVRINNHGTLVKFYAYHMNQALGEELPISEFYSSDGGVEVLVLSTWNGIIIQALKEFSLEKRIFVKVDGNEVVLAVNYQENNSDKVIRVGLNARTFLKKIKPEPDEVQNVVVKMKAKKVEGQEVYFYKYRQDNLYGLAFGKEMREVSLFAITRGKVKIKITPESEGKNGLLRFVIPPGSRLLKITVLDYSRTSGTVWKVRL